MPNREGRRRSQCPFTFATKASGSGWGLNPLKIYNAQGKEIVQDIKGNTDTNGGITIVTEQASSMLETIKNPNTLYAVGGYAQVVNPLDKTVYNYYWTSYSRGTDGTSDGNSSSPNWNNTYLDGYNQQRTKSVFDPCPYGFRMPVNGNYNMFNLYPSWQQYSYTGGVKFNIKSNCSWFNNTGVRRSLSNGILYFIGSRVAYCFSTPSGSTNNYVLEISPSISYINTEWWGVSNGFNVRCTEGWSVFFKFINNKCDSSISRHITSSSEAIHGYIKCDHKSL